MAFDNKEVALRARNLITEQSPARVDLTVPHFQALIPTTLEAWGRTAMMDPKKRDLLRGTITVPVVAGVVDLTTRLDGTLMALELDAVKKTTVYTTIASVRTPLTWVQSQNQLNATRNLSSGRPAIFLDGVILRVRNTDGSLTTFAGNIFFEAQRYPQTVTEIPFTLRQEFITYLAMTGVKEKAPTAAR